MGYENTRYRLIVVVAWAVLTAPAGAADVLYKRRTGVVVARDACRSRETPVDLDVSARVYNSTPISVPGPDQTLTFDSERWDRDNIHDITVNPSRLTARTAGKYLIYCNVEWTPSDQGAREVYIRRNSGPLIVRDGRLAAGLFGDVTGMAIATHIELAVNDYVECVVRQSSGGPLDAGTLNEPDIQSDLDFGMVKVP